MKEMQEMQVWSLGQEDPLEKEIATCILVWKIPWTEEPGRPQPIGSQRVRHYWAHTRTHMHTLPYYLLTSLLVSRKELITRIENVKRLELWITSSKSQEALRQDSQTSHTSTCTALINLSPFSSRKIICSIKSITSLSNKSVETQPNEACSNYLSVLKSNIK